MQQRESSSRAPTKQLHVPVSEVEQDTSARRRKYIGQHRFEQDDLSPVAFGAAGKVLVRKSLINTFGTL